MSTNYVLSSAKLNNYSSGSAVPYSATLALNVKFFDEGDLYWSLEYDKIETEVIAWDDEGEYATSLYLNTQTYEATHPAQYHEFNQSISISGYDISRISQVVVNQRAYISRWNYSTSSSYYDLDNSSQIASFTISKPGKITWNSGAACTVPSTSTGSASVSWGNATAPSGNAISGFIVQYLDYNGSSTVGGWTQTGGTFSSSARSMTDTIPESRIEYSRQYRVRAMSSLGDSFSSDWLTSSAKCLRTFTVGTPAFEFNGSAGYNCKIRITTWPTLTGVSTNNVTYRFNIFRDNTYIGYIVDNTLNQWVTIDQSLVESWGSSVGNFFVVAVVFYTPTGNSVSSANSATKTWKFVRNIIKYSPDGQPFGTYLVHCCSDGQSWQNCRVHYYDGSSWKTPG